VKYGKKYLNNKKRRTPSPRRKRTPSPRRKRTPSPRRKRTPSPRRKRTPSPSIRNKNFLNQIKHGVNLKKVILKNRQNKDFLNQIQKKMKQLKRSTSNNNIVKNNYSGSLHEMFNRIIKHNRKKIEDDDDDWNS